VKLSDRSASRRGAAATVAMASAWYERIVHRVKGGEDLEQIRDDDPFDLLSTCRALAVVAREASKCQRNMLRALGLGKAENLMTRDVDGRRELVYADPIKRAQTERKTRNGKDGGI
jgi:hypothetical protein